MAVLGEMMPGNEDGTVIGRGAVAAAEQLADEEWQVALLTRFGLLLLLLLLRLMLRLLLMLMMELLDVGDGDDGLVQRVTTAEALQSGTRAEVRLRLDREFLLLRPRTRTTNLHTFHRRLFVVLDKRKPFSFWLIFHKYVISGIFIL